MRRRCYECGAVLLPFGDATGGHGVPGVGLIPELLGVVLLSPWLLLVPGVDGVEVDDPELEDPVLGVEPDVPFAVPGSVPHGEPLGGVPGVFGEFGFMVEGCVVVPGVGVCGEVELGTVVFGDVDPDGLCGVAVPAGGVAVPA